MSLGSYDAVPLDEARPSSIRHKKASGTGSVVLTVSGIAIETQ